MPKLLHTSDIQLGASFRFLGEQGEHHRRQLEQTIARIVQMAQDDSYDILLISGDLFDSNSVAQETVDFTIRTLGDISLPVCILPGNHDALTERSIYRRTTFSSNVHILSDTPTYLDFPELDLTVAGVPLRNNYSTESALTGIRRTDRRRWFVVMAHGNLQIPGLVENTARPIHPQELEATGADYVALGDWHSCRDYSQGAVKAWYSGAPEPTGINQDGAGHVLSVELNNEGVFVAPISVGAVHIRTLAIDVSGLETNDVISHVQEIASPNTMLLAKLTGLKVVGVYLDMDAIREAVSPLCYWLQIEDASTPALASISADEFPDTLVIGRYVRLLAKRIEQTSDERERRVAEQALQIGVALLQGKEVLR